MARLLANVGDTFLKTTSAQSELRVHATARQDGKTGVMLINTDPNISIPAAVTHQRADARQFRHLVSIRPHQFHRHQ